MISASKLKKTFEGKTVLITGHTGFKGSWLTFMLQQLGAKTVGYSIAPPSSSKHCYFALKVEKGLLNSGESFHDIKDYDSLNSVFEEYNPDFFFHLAAQAIVSTSYESPLDTIETNVMGTANCLEVIRKKEQAITSVIITSDKCYKNKERFEPYQEEEEMGGDDPYSASKGACELVFHSYLTSYFQSNEQIRIASTRAGNVFGGGDWSDNRLVPDVIRDVLDKGCVDIRSPKAVRPWTFVVDILYGYLSLAHCLSVDDSFKGSWNFASGETRTVLDVCNAIIDSLEEGRVNVDESFSIGKECGLLLVDETKARTQIGWDLVYSVDEAFSLTANWYHTQHKGGDMLKHSSDFLNEFFANTGG